MNNPLYDIIRKANEQRWCMTPYCTTCGSREYRKALKDLSGPLGGGLANALCDINPQDITSIPNWQNALLVAIIDLPISMQVGGVLEAWLEKTWSNIFFIDLVLYKIVRHLPKDNETRNLWIDRCMTMALNTKDFSLVESLVLVLRQDALGNSELIAIAKEHAKTSAQMRRVLRNACNLTVTAEST